VNIASRNCLDAEGAKRDEGANIQVWGFSGRANQSWLFRK
jgi:hypothetical protein